MDRRSNYLDVALDLFVERGYHGVSVDEVVARAGGSKATLYRYFPSKRDLFDGIIDDLSSVTLPADDGVDIAGKSLADALADLGRRVAAAALSERAIVLLRLAIGESQRFPELGRVLYERGPAVSYERLRHLIRVRTKAGELRVPDVEVAIEQFISGIVGHQQLRMVLGIDTPTAKEIDARVDGAVTSFVANYATH